MGAGLGRLYAGPRIDPSLAPGSDGVDIIPGQTLSDDLERLGLQLWAGPDRLRGLWCAQVEDATVGCLRPLLPLLCVLMVGAAASLPERGSTHTQWSMWETLLFLQMEGF